jgi:lauroyl/myristoyl acyltransferase
MFPFKISYSLTTIFALIAFVIFKTKRDAVKKNLTYILKRTPTYYDVIQVFIEYGKYWAEIHCINRLWNLTPKENYGAVFPPREKCFVGLTFHIGNFEIFGNILFPFYKKPFCVIAERLTPHFLADYFKKVRLGHHIQTIAHDNLRQMIRVLKNGDPLGVVCDRLIKGAGVETRFFGKRVFMPLNIVDYAIQNKIPVYIAYCTNENKRLKIFCRRADEVNNFDAAIKIIANTLEEAVCQYPYQWHVLSEI